MTSIADRKAEQRRAKLQEISGRSTLTVRTMTGEERKRYPSRPPKLRRT